VKRIGIFSAVAPGKNSAMSHNGPRKVVIHDWRKWLMTKSYRPFDPQVYCEFRLYKDFSSGIPDQWMSHATDLVHWFTPESLSDIPD
jgi:hypothetical protein